MKIFVVIPLFNEKKHIASVIKNVSKYKLPIVVVDDGSTDGSGLKIIALRDKELRNKNVTVLTHRINLGKGAAMKTGADYAFSRGADAVIFMDSDGQHEASDLLKFIDALKDDRYDVILGSRNLNYGVPLVRFLGNKFASVLMVLLFKVYVSDVICGFRAITKDGYKKVKWDSDGYGVETEMVARIGKNKTKFSEIPVQTIYHDVVKGVTLLDAFEVLGNVVKWKLTLK
jgi:glycosyltransferase involved in cell wall biosynthesis